SPCTCRLHRHRRHPRRRRPRTRHSINSSGSRSCTTAARSPTPSSPRRRPRSSAADPASRHSMSDDAEPQAPPAPDPTALLRSRSFVVLLVFSALIGIIVSLISWGFLELVHQTQIGVFRDLPDRLGFSDVPWWWPLPVLFVAGIIVAAAIVYLPGNGGHVPAHGLQVGTTEPPWIPGVALAAFATLALGAVLGPEAPLIAVGSGLAVFTVKLAKRDAPPQLLIVLGAAGSFAAISVVLGSPIVAAVLVIEASGLGGA